MLELIFTKFQQKNKIHGSISEIFQTLIRLHRSIKQLCLQEDKETEKVKQTDSAKTSLPNSLNETDVNTDVFLCGICKTNLVPSSLYLMKTFRNTIRNLSGVDLYIRLPLSSRYLCHDHNEELSKIEKFRDLIQEVNPKLSLSQEDNLAFESDDES